MVAEPDALADYNYSRLVACGPTDRTGIGNKSILITHSIRTSRELDLPGGGWGLMNR